MKLQFKLRPNKLKFLYFSINKCFRNGLKSTIILFTLLLNGCGPDSSSDSANTESTGVVVVYSSVDEPYSRPILRTFEKMTGIEVLARYDTEMDKTAGLSDRLFRERSRPNADVFWNSEVLYTVRLVEKGIFTPYISPVASEIPLEFHSRVQQWTGIATRARVLIYNTNLVNENVAPKSIADLASSRWKGKVTMALPLAGTTSTHAGALWARLGETGAVDFFKSLKNNGVRIANGNAHVRDLVVSGIVAIGITDTDDAHEAIQRNAPIRMVFPDQEVGFPGLKEPLGAFFIPNTVALVKGGPNPTNGKKLVDYLLSAEVEMLLRESGSAQIPVRPHLSAPEKLKVPAKVRLMEVSYEDAARGMTEAKSFLKKLFLQP